MSRGAVLLWTTVIAVGIVALFFFVPVLAGLIFVVLTIAGAVAIGRKEGGWKGFVAFAKNMIFGW